MLCDPVTGSSVLVLVVLAVVSVYAVVELVATVSFFLDASAVFSVRRTFYISCVHVCITSVPGFFVVLSRKWAYNHGSPFV